MNRKLWMGTLLVFVALASVSAAWFFRGLVRQPSEEGFRLVFLQDNELLISDADVLSYNWTSQEVAITVAASERLMAMGDDLYSFSGGFVISIDGEEVYRGIFRMAVHSAIPESPKISIMFPSMLFPSNIENCGAVRMFYPFFEPPSNQPEANARLFQHFEASGKLTY